jgi:cation:H+ antiporter
MLYLELSAGLILLLLGGDALVRGGIGMAHRLGVSPLLIGLTLVGFGTSTPELITSVEAALRGAPGIAVGNVVGSNIANILLIVGLAALIYPLTTSRRMLRRDGAVMLLAALACIAAVLLGTISRPVGLLLVLLLGAYVYASYRRERGGGRRADDAGVLEIDAAGLLPKRLGFGLLLLAGGLGLTVLGARLLVDAAIDLATAAGVSETVVGLTVVAIGTSLPELATSAIAAYRRHADVAIGNIVGSNIYNVLGVLGATAVVKPIAVPPEIARLDVWVMLAATLLLLLFAFTGSRICRAEGVVFLAGYVAYVGWLVVAAV